MAESLMVDKAEHVGKVIIAMKKTKTYASKITVSMPSDKSLCVVRK